ncbi:hypothetical protein H1P_5730002 [Hyella patelloides LEGE 07179]|uniref:Uncharacterized protein n=1 Tax=Hyella patelloides LEGE 07179 TaxID=945734 RepID=A0A563W0M4_9CYAN|nr:hypothetical protein H1P_5730002 [Hyella patelloides LEGE 07179]
MGILSAPARERVKGAITTLLFNCKSPNLKGFRSLGELLEDVMNLISKVYRMDWITAISKRVEFVVPSLIDFI